MTRLPQFPLGSILLPTMVLPLHVFEPRYRVMIDELVAGDREFGVVMIERGTEVGGNDVRHNVGTVARILEAETFDDGRSALVTLGTRRFKVTSWLPDDPYPVAEVEFWPDEPPVTVTRADLDQAVAKLERCVELARRAGVDLGKLPELSDEIELASMQVAAMAPIAAFDKQKLLEAAGPDARVPMLDRALADAIELIEFQLGDN
ncbi:MAG: Lon protease-like protein [Acidimicrobiales bacterium]|jgi:uncharacterized protein